MVQPVTLPLVDRTFAFDGLPTRVLFGAGRVTALADEARRLGSRALLLSTPELRPLAERGAGLLGDVAVAIHAEARMHVPVSVVDAAAARLDEARADMLIALGGGSTTGLAKALALRTGLPILAVPTTYAGSEMTPIWGITDGGVKRTGRDLTVLPRTAIYDPELTLSLPATSSATSALNAVAHCVEGLYSPDANPLTSIMAEEGIRAIARGLPVVVAQPAEMHARADLLYGAWLGGVVLGSVGMAIHHKLCHTLGGTFDLPHAETHAVVLPHAAAYNAAAAPEAMVRIARALGVADAPRGLHDLLLATGAPRSLRSLGMPAEGIERALDLALASPYPNPAPLRREPLRRLLHDALEGRAPSAAATLAVAGA